MIMIFTDAIADMARATIMICIAITENVNIADHMSGLTVDSGQTAVLNSGEKQIFSLDFPDLLDKFHAFGRKALYFTTL